MNGSIIKVLRTMRPRLVSLTLVILSPVMLADTIYRQRTLTIAIYTFRTIPLCTFTLAA